MTVILTTQPCVIVFEYPVIRSGALLSTSLVALRVDALCAFAIYILPLKERFASRFASMFSYLICSNAIGIMRLYNVILFVLICVIAVKAVII